MKRLRIATRQSNLALTQTRWVAAQLQALHPGLEVEEIHVVSKGDKVLDKPLYAVGGKGLFVTAVEEIVVRGDADVAVHSLKDVPGDQELAPGMDLLCFPEREDPHDVLVTRDGSDLMSLEAGAKVGTTSLRRASQLKAQRGDLAFGTLRGNVETRLGRLEEGRFDAIVLAAAGLKRLGYLADLKHHVLPPEHCLPAVGQGTLGLEGAAERPELRALLAPLEHGPTRVVTEAERAFLKALQGSCRVPIAGHARLFDGGERLSLQGLVGDIDGEQLLSASSDVFLKGRTREERIAEAVALGRGVAQQLIERGAREMMRQAEATIARRQQLDN